MQKNGRRARDKDRTLVCTAVAKVNISAASYSHGKDFVRFAIQPYSIRGRKNVSKLFIYDHRPTVVSAAKKSPIPEGDRYRIESLQGAALRRELEKVRTVAQVVNATPARVIVMERRRGRDFLCYVNLFHAEGSKPTALLSESVYPGKFFTIEDNSLWSWGAKNCKNSRNKVALVALTNEKRRSVISNFPNKNSRAIVGITIRTERKGEAFGDDEMIVEGSAP